jgi:hypothetical protein
MEYCPFGKYGRSDRITKRVLVFVEDGTFTYDNRVIRETSALIKEGWEVVLDQGMVKKAGVIYEGTGRN